MKQMLTFGRYCKRRFGQRVRKIPIALAGFTCPNIDGSVARGGCIFCKNESFSPTLEHEPKAPLKINPRMQDNPLLPMQLKQLHSQYQWQTDFHKNKFGVGKYLIYFQSFTNTYAPFDTLQKLYIEALNLPNVVGMSIGTRTDSVSLELLDYLANLQESRKQEIWIEYGIQSVYDETLKFINRGHTTEGMEYWIKETKQRGLKVCSHIIYGLPNESKEMMLNSLRQVLEWGSDGIKVHPLYIIEKTILAQMHAKGEYKPITLSEYIELIVETLKMIPQNIVIHRVSAGVRNDTLIAPKWCFDKNIQMRAIRDALRAAGIEY
ncbi:TIGR01212 family radical SAM protein [Helicobacter colisuis]|uniref:TIGR01212 family radical SAM protein n=1 Tax=Helicobacter colisuis TaxID=2949739 RepID=A0ABT0TSQ1_9HELI|nr:TIGR01212 family radical SAM protein [Helicobacter colisuis]MCL9818956.1 TIGR01212 family radical SAM protein [Helicobacter colisuis]